MRSFLLFSVLVGVFFVVGAVQTSRATPSLADSFATLGPTGGSVLNKPSSRDNYQLGALYYIPGRAAGLQKPFVEIDNLCSLVPGHKVDNTPATKRTFPNTRIVLNRTNTADFNATLKTFGFSANVDQVESVTLKLSNVKFEALNEPVLRQAYRVVALANNKCRNIWRADIKRSGRKEVHLGGIVSADYELATVTEFGAGGSASFGGFFRSIFGEIDGGVNHENFAGVVESGKNMVFKVYSAGQL